MTLLVNYLFIRYLIEVQDIVLGARTEKEEEKRGGGERMNKT